MQHVHLQPAFVLHRRPYRETSFLIDIFTEQYGRLTVIAKGARKKKSPQQSILQPFRSILVSWAGRTELMTLTQVEARGNDYVLHGECLFAGLYLNELLIYLLQKWDPHADLFHLYAQTLKQLQAQTLQEKWLRSFEKFLLQVLGYGLLPTNHHELLQTFNAEHFYQFLPEHGFVVSEKKQTSVTSLTNLFAGKSLLAIAQDDWQDSSVVQDAKRLMRLVLTPLLGDRPIYSRRLFLKPHEEIQK